MSAKTFTYNAPYGTYPECFFMSGRYQDNDNLAIEIWSLEEGCVTRVTVNTDTKLTDDMIAIKNYSENEGMVDYLVSEGFIEETPVMTIPSGFVLIPVHVMTQKFLDVLEIPSK